MLAKLFSRLFGRKARRRAEILAQPLPPSWQAAFQRRLFFYRKLTDDERARLHQLVQVFMAEKYFVLTNGLQLADELKAMVAAEACRLLIKLPHLDVFPRLKEIIVYPHDFTEHTEAIGPDGRVYPIHRTRAGEAWRRGPVILAWNSVQHSVASPRDGYNVIIHEFAHVIDLQEGETNGIPPLQTREEYERWTRVFFAEFDGFVAAQRKGIQTLIDPYGATNPAEFFAVTSEHFFEQPELLLRFHPQLYTLFAGFYQQDPAKSFELRVAGVE